MLTRTPTFSSLQTSWCPFRYCSTATAELRHLDPGQQLPSGPKLSANVRCLPGGRSAAEYRLQAVFPQALESGSQLQLDFRLARGKDPSGALLGRPVVEHGPLTVYLPLTWEVTSVQSRLDNAQVTFFGACLGSVEIQAAEVLSQYFSISAST